MNDRNLASQPVQSPGALLLRRLLQHRGARSSLILLVLFFFKPATTLPGLVIVATGFPIYFLWRRGAAL